MKSGISTAKPLLQLKMKHLILYTVLILFISSAWQIHGQGNNIPEELKAILEEKKLPEVLDSLENRKFEDYRSRLGSSKPVEQINGLLIGSWASLGNVRINENLTKIKPDIDSITFFEDGRFRSYTSGKRKEGDFQLRPDVSHNLILIYDSLQSPPLPKEILANMNAEQIEAQSYYSVMFNIFEIENEILVLYQIMPLFNPMNPADLTHSRLILNYFNKK